MYSMFSISKIRNGMLVSLNAFVGFALHAKRDTDTIAVHTERQWMLRDTKPQRPSMITSTT